MKHVFLTQVIMCISCIVFSQPKSFQGCVRVPIQYDIQKAKILFSYGTEERKGVAINFGLDGLVGYEVNKITFFAGVGLFRNRFNIRRGYDHQALNPERDSLPIGTETTSYAYSLIRLPLGFNFRILEIGNCDLGIGTELVNNFSFRQKYNGTLPFSDANTTYGKLRYFGNNINFNLSLSKSIDKNMIALEPFVRIYNKYNGDRFLEEKENTHITRYFDSYGISIKFLIF